MTSSNVAPTDEGRAAAATTVNTTTAASPPPATATSPSPRPPSRADGDEDASGGAVTAPSASNAKLNLTLDAPTTIKPLSTTSETGTVDQRRSSADLSDQPQPDHDQPANEINTDIPIPSPPTVSPLSTPAATHINVDESLPDDAVAKLSADFPPLSLTQDSSTFRSGIFGPPQPANHGTLFASDGMQLDEPFMPAQMRYRQHGQVQAIATTDPDPHSADYSHGILSGMRLSQGSIDPSAYIMNIAAQATLFQDQGPSVIAPSAVSLHSVTQESDALTGSAEPASTNGSQKLESFAKIEFADSTFQMTTYAVIIGRDKQAMEQARADERREAAYRRKCEENERNGLPPPTPIMYDKGKFSKSYVSEEGGMLGPEHSDGEDVKPVKKRRPSSAAQSAAGEDNASGNRVQSNRQYVSHTTGAAAVDLGALQPSPEHIPFIGIHSPGPDIASKTRGISRQHLKIQFNKKRGVFEGIALHKNGFFCEDVLYGLDQPATLRSGDRLQIKDVEFFFVINGVQIGMSGGEDEDVASSKRMSVGGKEMSLDFEHSDHENFRDTSEELSDVENISTPVIESEHGDEEREPAPTPVSASLLASVADQRQEPELEVTGAQPIAGEERPHEMIKPELDMLGELPPEFAMPDIPKRRGPGRPPKDGIMSKRERRLLKKQLQETSKKTLPQDLQEEKIKRPVGRPRKNPLLDDGERPEKRKYNKKKREDGEEGSDPEKPIKEKKDKKVRPKSPPLDLRIEDYTAEQLQKPTKNYGVLIDEALTNGPPDGLTLKQIYKRITARYPWFFFRSETKGWESSVRHNLIGNEAFKKDEETGLWSRVPGVELDAGKKRKATSPDRHLGPSHLHSHLSHPPYYQSNPYANPSNATYAHALPNYHTEQKHPQPGYTSTGQNAQLHTTPSQSLTQPVSQPVYTAHVPAPAQLPPGYGSLTQPRPSNTPQQGTYSSPYARPPPPSNPPAKIETSQSNTQTTTASSTTQSAAPALQQQPRPSVASVGPREQLSPEIERAIVQFSANMLNVISKQTPHAASIIEAAANRVRGLPVQNRIPGFDSVENTLINAMQGMIKDMRQKYHHIASASPAPIVPAQSSSTLSPAPPNTAEAEIQRRLRNFRESMVTALKTKTDKAEIIVDSAINRARGLPHAGKIPGWEEADNLMVKSVTQIIAEARSAHLKLQNVSPTPANTSRTAVSQPAQSVLRPEPSASPAAAQTPIASATPRVPPSNGTSTAPYTSSAPSSVLGAPNSNSPSIARPGMPLQRPAPVAFTRPPTGPIARPTVFHKDSVTASTTTPAVPRPNVSSPAPPSAGVLDQITGHKRFTDDVFHKSHSANGGVTMGSHTGSNAATSCNTVSNSGASTTSSSSVVNTTLPSGTASNVTSTTANNATSNAASNKAGSSVSNPASTPSINIASNPAGSAPTNVSKIQTSSFPSNMASQSASSVTGNISNSVMGNHTDFVSGTGNVDATNSSASSNIRGGTPRITASHITSSATGNASSDNPPETTIDVANHTAAVAADSSTRAALGATLDLEPGLTQGSNASTNTSVAIGATVSPLTSGPAGGAVGAQISNSVGESTHSKLENEKSIPSRATMMEHHEPTAFKAPAPIHNMSSPAPPSAGVVDQIAGHKRSLDEGPGSANAEQPEPKRLGVFPV